MYVYCIFILASSARIIAEPIPQSHHPVNAFSAGMGLTGVAISNNPVTIFWNASGLNRMEQLGLDFTVAAPNIESPGTWSFLMANASSNQDTRFGLGMTRRHAKNEHGTFKSFDLILPLSHGFKAGRIPFGFSLKFISESIDEGDWKYGMSVDIGAMWLYGSGLKFGLSYMNIGGSDLEAFQNELWLGTYWSNAISPLSFSSQIRGERLLDSDYISQNFGVGVNYRLPDYPFDRNRKIGSFEIRGGLKKAESKTWYTFGFDFIQAGSDTHIGYAVVIDAETWSGRSHYLTYGYSYAAGKRPKSVGGTPFS